MSAWMALSRLTQLGQDFGSRIGEPETVRKRATIGANRVFARHTKQVATCCHTIIKHDVQAVLGEGEVLASAIFEAIDFRRRAYRLDEVAHLGGAFVFANESDELGFSQCRDAHLINPRCRLFMRMAATVFMV